MTLEQMINEQQMLLNEARTQGRSLTAEEQARFDSLQRSIDAARAAAPSGGNGTGSEVSDSVGTCSSYSSAIKTGENSAKTAGKKENVQGWRYRKLPRWNVLLFKLPRRKRIHGQCWSG